MKPVVWEYTFFDKDALAQNARTTVFLPNEDAEDVVESLVEERHDAIGNYPEETTVYIRRQGETMWQKFTVYAEMRMQYRVVETKLC